MKRVPLVALVFIMASVISLYAQATLNPESVPRMTAEQVNRQMASPDFVIIDVRTSHDWDGSTMKIKRSDPGGRVQGGFLDRQVSARQDYSSLLRLSE